MQGRADSGGEPQDVHDEHRATLHLGRGEAEWREQNVQLHDSGSKSCGWRSRNLVSTRPATKSGWRMTRPRKGIVVVTPSRTKLSNAWPIRASASSRSLPWTITFARRES